jgi:hypothetical protein
MLFDCSSQEVIFMGGNVSLEFDTGAVVNTEGGAVVRVANTGENGEHVTVFLMPGLVLQADLDLPPQDIEVITFSIGAKFSPPQLNWVKIQVSTDQVVPMATLSDDAFGTITYLPGDFAAFSLLQSGGKARLW